MHILDRFFNGKLYGSKLPTCSAPGPYRGQGPQAGCLARTDREKCRPATEFSLNKVPAAGMAFSSYGLASVQSLIPSPVEPRDPFGSSAANSFRFQTEPEKVSCPILRGLRAFFSGRQTSRPGLHTANAMRSKTDDAAKAPLTSVRLRKHHSALPTKRLPVQSRYSPELP